MAPQLWPLGVHKHLMGDKCQRGLRGGPEVGCALGTPGNAFLAGAQGTRELQWLQAGRQPPRPHIATGRGLTWTISPHFTERPPSLRRPHSGTATLTRDCFANHFFLGLIVWKGKLASASLQWGFGNVGHRPFPRGREKGRTGVRPPHQTQV